MNPIDQTDLSQKPGIFLYIPPVINKAANQNKSIIVRKVIFLYINLQAQPTVYQCKNYKKNKVNQLYSILNIPIHKYKDYQFYKIQTIDQNSQGIKLDPLKTFQQQSCKWQSEIFCIDKNVTTIQELISYRNKKKQQQKKIKLRIDNIQHQYNAIGIKKLQQIKKLQPNQIIVQKCIKDKKKRGGIIINDDQDISQSKSLTFYCVKGQTSLLFLKQIKMANLPQTPKNLQNPQNQQQQLLSQIQKQFKNCSLVKGGIDIETQSVLQKCQSYKKNTKIYYNNFYQNNKIKLTPLAVLPIWTTDRIYRYVNYELRTKIIINNYKKYLYYFQEALKRLQNQDKLLYRGFAQYKDRAFKIGDTIFWRTINSASLKREQALKFCSIPNNNLRKQQQSKKRGTLFIIKSKTAKSTKEFSYYPEQKQYIIYPYTLFKIKQIILNDDKQDQVTIQQIPCPRSTNILLWFKLNKRFKKSDKLKIILFEVNHEYSVLPIYEHKQALDILQNFKWMFENQYFNLKIILDCCNKTDLKQDVQVLKNISESNMKQKWNRDTGIYEDIYNENIQKQIIPFLKILEQNKYNESIFFLTNSKQESQLYKKLIRIQFQQKFMKNFYSHNIIDFQNYVIEQNNTNDSCFGNSNCNII